ncbi:MAG TPA: ABC transporter substrate-binding protein [Fibrobacteraceae bacterium]|nr:ABC transporter substrate-binding protein [Fibrobacteraceae bacterium]
MSQQTKYKRTAWLLASVVIVAVIALLFFSLPKQASSSSGGLPIIHLAGGNVGAPSPFGSISPGSSTHSDLIFDGLLENDENGVVPWLAKSWEISPDGLTYVFHLRNRVRWHDGQPFSAQDVAFTFNFFRTYPQPRNELMVDAHYIVENAEALDDTTVRLTVDGASSIYLAKIGSVNIIPRHIWEGVKDPLKVPPEKASIGTGPFRFTAFSSQHGTYRLDAFPGFWGPKAVVAAVEWIPVGDQVLAFESGTIDLISVGPDLAARYRGNPEFKISEGHNHSGCRLVFNLRQRPELKDKTIRQAFAYGTNREEMVEKLARGAGAVGSAGSIPADHPFYNPKAAPYPFDLDKARQLLAERTFTFDILARNNMDEIKVAELMKITLAKIGITLNVRSLDGKTRNQILHTGKYDLALYKSGFGGDPDYLRTSYGAPKTEKGLGGNTVGYYNDTLYHLGRQSLRELDTAKRRVILNQMQEVVAEEVPQLILYTIIENYVYRPARFNGWRFRSDRLRNTSDMYKLSFLEDWKG